MKTSFERKLLFFFILLFLAKVVQGIIAKRNNDSFINTNALIIHTHQVLYQAEELLSITSDFESGSRGYIITGDTSYLLKHAIAKENIDDHLIKLKELTKDDPLEKARIDSLSLLINKRINFSWNTIQLRSEKGEEAAKQLIATREGKDYMDQIRKIIAEIRDAENILLVQRNEANDKSMVVFTRSFYGLLISAFIFLVVIFFVVRQNFIKRKKIEGELKESNEKFLALFYGSPVAMIIRDIKDGKIIDINQEYERLLGYKKEQIQGKTSFEVGMVTDKQVGDQIRTAVAAKKFLKNIETSLINTEKEIINVLISVEHIRIGERECILSALLDITERKRAEEQVRLMNEELERRVIEKTKEVIDQEERYRFALDNMIEGIQIIDRDWRYVYLNNSAASHGDSSKKEMLGHTMMEKYPGIENTEIFQALRKCMEEGSSHHMENEFTYSDGTTRCFEFSIQSVPEGLLILSMDVNDRKEAEREISMLNESLERKVMERTLQYEAVNKELEAFSYSVSHDLRAPLRAVGGYAKMLEEDYGNSLDAEGKRLLGEVQINAGRMGLLIDDLLAFSRMGKKAIRRSLVDMSELTNAAAVESRKSFSTNAKIVINQLHPVMADHSLMMQVMTNLLSNGIKYTSRAPNPMVEVSSEQKNGKVVYSVKDNGAGFDMQYAHKLFGVFQRLHTTDEFDGTGVGLAIVQRIINKHGGMVWAEATVDKGATFYFSLPALQTPKMTKDE
jgi:PAS domain S-box-containing protein